MTNIALENPLEMEVLMGKSSANGPFSIAMLNYQGINGNITLRYGHNKWLTRDITMELCGGSFAGYGVSNILHINYCLKSIDLLEGYPI
jgi:hypothetical protein